MIKAGIYGASGYTGLETIRLLLNHPNVDITSISSQTYVGKVVQDVFPHLKKLINKKFEESSPTDMGKKCDVIFCGLPHGVSMSYLPLLLEAGARVIDLSADFRLKDQHEYKSWYNRDHVAPDLLESSVYGLSEIKRKDIGSAQLIANPGCYPTSILLPVTPLLEKGLVKAGTIICDSKSAVSGAGRNVKERYLFTECDEDMSAYSLLSHRHVPEIEQELNALSVSKIQIIFTPHLIPIKRGMLSSIYLDICEGVTFKEIENAFQERYGNERFIRFVNEGEAPRARDVAGTNYCDIGFHLDNRTGKLILLSAIDNLGKGAAGQAVQNMNIMFGFPEETGLTAGAALP